jgi:hypothetical protein
MKEANSFLYVVFFCLLVKGIVRQGKREAESGIVRTVIYIHLSAEYKFTILFLAKSLLSVL